ncbi:MAG: hypothetical protein WC154_02870 [Candidatus Izemoplasmatales bacterium]
MQSRLRIQQGLSSYLQDVLYEDVYSPKWMVEDKEFFLELIENSNQVKTKFFKHEEIDMIK